MSGLPMSRPPIPRPPVRPARSLPALRERLALLVARADLAPIRDLRPLRHEIEALCEEIARANPVATHALRALTRSR